MASGAGRNRRERTFVGSECAVCEEPLEHTLRGERILQFSCSHVSHEACFYEFIREFESQYCPSCDAPLHLDTSRGGNVLDIGKRSPMSCSPETRLILLQKKSATSFDLSHPPTLGQITPLRPRLRHGTTTQRPLRAPPASSRTSETWPAPTPAKARLEALDATGRAASHRLPRGTALQGTLAAIARPPASHRLVATPKRPKAARRADTIMTSRQWRPHRAAPAR